MIDVYELQPGYVGAWLVCILGILITNELKLGSRRFLVHSSTILCTYPTKLYQLPQTAP